MENHASADPRDQAIRAALADASRLASMVADEIPSSYHGQRRDLYVETLRTWIADLGGRLDAGEGRDLVAHFPGRRITLRFG
jgi:hypothetical protein